NIHRPFGLLARARPAAIVEHRSYRSESIVMLTAIRSSGWTFLARAARLSRFWTRDERGSMAILTGISLTVLLAFAGLGVDVSFGIGAKSDAQAAADAAANSVGAAAAQGSPNARIQSEANAAAAVSGFNNGMNGVTVTVNNPPTLGAYA